MKIIIKFILPDGIKENLTGMKIYFEGTTKMHLLPVLDLIAGEVY
jgi:hypothetical protein